MSPRDVRASAADEFSRVVICVNASLQVASSLAAVVGFVALEAHVVGVSMHGVTGRVRVKASACAGKVEKKLETKKRA